jgi:hypothetical protein
MDIVQLQAHKVGKEAQGMMRLRKVPYELRPRIPVAS